jgi:hypothetical protein
MLAYPAWPETGSQWSEAFDSLDLMHLDNIARPLKPSEPARSANAGRAAKQLALLLGSVRFRCQSISVDVKNAEAFL